MVSRREINQWIEEGKIVGATHLLVVCDTFDYEDYPVFIMPGEDYDKRVAEYDGVNMQSIHEIIDLKKA